MSTLVLVACNQGKSESESESESESGTTGADIQATDASTSGDAITTGSESASSSATDGTSTGDAATTAGSGGDSLPASCEAYCTTLMACFSLEQDEFYGCIEECISGWGYGPEGIDWLCNNTLIDLNNCYAAATCRELESMRDPCDIELGAVETSCVWPGSGECFYHASGDAEHCWLDQECPGSFLSIECEEDLCTCYDFDIGPVGTCSSDVCVDEVDVDTLLQKALECCSWRP